MIYLVITVYLGVSPTSFAVEDLHSCGIDRVEVGHLIGPQAIPVRITCETDPNYARYVVFPSVDDLKAAIRENAHARNH